MTNTSSSGSGGLRGIPGQTGNTSRHNNPQDTTSILADTARMGQYPDPEVEGAAMRAHLKVLNQGIQNVNEAKKTENLTWLDEKREIARKLLEKRVPIETIAYATGLSILEVTALSRPT